MIEPTLVKIVEQGSHGWTWVVTVGDVTVVGRAKTWAETVVGFLSDAEAGMEQANSDAQAAR